MNKYFIRWNRDDYGHIVIEAETEEQARELFETGDWHDKDLVIKNGGIEIEDVEMLPPTETDNEFKDSMSPNL